MAASTPVAFNTRSGQRKKRRSPTFLAGSSENQAGKGAQAVVSSASRIMGDQADESKHSAGERSSSISDRNSPSRSNQGSGERNELPAEGEDAGVQVLSTEELTALEDPASAACARLKNAFTSQDWLEQYEGTTTVRQLVACHADAEAAFSGFVLENFDSILRLLTLGVGSLRSAMIRNALFAIGELFEQLPKLTEPKGNGAVHFLQHANRSAVEALVDAVVIKSVNEKRFIAVAGEAVLDKMIRSVPSLSFLRPMLKHADSKSGKVCSVVARYGARCLKDVLEGVEGKVLIEKSAKQAIVAFAMLEGSRSVEAKQPAAKALRLLHKAVAGNEFERALSDSMTPAQVAKVMSIVTKKAPDGSKKKPSIKEMMAQKRREMITAAAAAENSAVAEKAP